jgi:hypothetical protein
MKASTLSFKTAVVFAVAGIAMGIAMAASQDHSVMPAHAHLNLLGWVSLFLIGTYYRLHPPLDASRMAVAQVVVWIMGTLILTTGVAAIHLGYTSAEPIAIVGSLVIFTDMLAFAIFVFRSATKGGRAAEFAPAE